MYETALDKDNNTKYPTGFWCIWMSHWPLSRWIFNLCKNQSAMMLSLRITLTVEATILSVISPRATLRKKAICNNHLSMATACTFRFRQIFFLLYSYVHNISRPKVIFIFINSLKNWIKCSTIFVLMSCRTNCWRFSKSLKQYLPHSRRTSAHEPHAGFNSTFFQCGAKRSQENSVGRQLVHLCSCFELIRCWQFFSCFY